MRAPAPAPAPAPLPPVCLTVCRSVFCPSIRLPSFVHPSNIWLKLVGSIGIYGGVGYLSAFLLYVRPPWTTELKRLRPSVGGMYGLGIWGGTQTYKDRHSKTDFNRCADIQSNRQRDIVSQFEYHIHLNTFHHASCILIRWFFSFARTFHRARHI